MIDVLVVDDDFPQYLPERTGRELMRIIQEALANAEEAIRAVLEYRREHGVAIAQYPIAQPSLR